MSDHIDGPRQIGDPSADLTDLFAFTSPVTPTRTVVAANVFPSCGFDAFFSNAIDHSIVLRRTKIAGIGDATKFSTSDPEIRFTCRFDTLERDPSTQKAIQRGTCILPGGQQIRFVVNDEKGAGTPDDAFRVFAGLRSDPFNLAWLLAGEMKPFQNLLLNDNVLCIVIEFDTRRVLDPDKGSLFGVIAETKPRPRTGASFGHEPPRIDWVGRPEQTNIRMNNGAIAGTDDIRDLWNQQTPFAIDERVRPLFLLRLKESLENWDMRDGKRDWPPSALAANAEMFLDDFLLLDVMKPITDSSHLEIEKSTLSGKPYQTGGGRTVDANVIDIMFTWMCNHDREPMHGGAAQATKPGMRSFPYFAQPNTDLQSVSASVDLAATPETVWELIKQFGGVWHPLITDIKLIGTGIGQLRIANTIDGKRIVERLESLDELGRSYRYMNISGIPASNYSGVLAVKAKGGGSTVEWQSEFLPHGQPSLVVKTIVSTLFKTGLAGLKSRFGELKSN